MTRRLLRKNRHPRRRPASPREERPADLSTDCPTDDSGGPDHAGRCADEADSDEPRNDAPDEAEVDPQRLADAARSCPALKAADRLAGWIGEGRAVQTVPVLFPVQLATAARALGGDGGPSALVPAWSRAQHAGLIQTRGDRTVAGPALEAWRAGEPAMVLQLWREAYENYTGLNSARSDEPYVRPEAFGAQAALRLLHARGRPVETVKVRRKVARMLRAAQRGLATGVLEPARDADAGMALLNQFGAVASDHHMVWLTPLGRWLVRSRREGAGWARGLVEHLRLHPSDACDALAERWMRTRNQARAVRDLLEVAAGCDPAERTIAVDLARRVDAAAESEWRRWVDHPTVGPYARTWVATIAEGRAPDQQDADWTLLDRVAGLLRSADRPEVRDAVRWHCHELLGLEATARMAAVDHPDRELVVGVLTEYHAFQRYLRLRVELSDVAEPPVWRTLLVPAGCTLGELHRALTTAIGWDGLREYVFEIAGRTYASFDDGRRGPDAERPRLLDLVQRGDSFRYEYDELDRWRHLITVESDDEEAPAGQWARVLGGSGACPPSECGGADGYRRLRSALSDPSDPDREHARQVLAVERPEDFDAQEFDPTLPNAVLAAETGPSVRAA